MQGEPGVPVTKAGLVDVHVWSHMIGRQSRKSEKEVIALKAWYKAMGVDHFSENQPQCWFESNEPAALEKSLEPSFQGQPQKRISLSVQETHVAPSRPSASSLASETRTLVRQAATLSELRGLLETFEDCGLKKTAKNICFAKGSGSADVMFVGEAPGKDEDAQGIPFVGRAGQLLNQMLAAIGLNETNVYITNLVFWRPPGNRTPSPEEVQVCLPFVVRQVELVSPQVIVFLGGAAAKHMLGCTEGILKLRGRWFEYPMEDRASIPAIATLHPAYLLRTPIAKRAAWRDLLMIRERLNEKR